MTPLTKLDIIIQHQAFIWLSLGVIAGLFALLGTLNGSHLFTFSRERWDKEWKEFTGRMYGGFPVPDFLLLPVLIIVGFVILAAVQPIPKTIALHLPAPLRDKHENPYLIIFIHGWTGDVAETWQDFPKLVIGDKRFEKCNVVSLSYPTYITQRSLTIPQLSQWLSRKLRQEGYYDRYAKICIVAHSMGGLVAREIVIGNRLEGVPEKVQKLVEIATPHDGAGIAGLIGAIGVGRAYIEDIKPGARYLVDLRDHWNALKPRPATFAITSKADLVVSESSALTQCDRFQVFPQWGHVDLAKPGSENDDRYSFPMDEVAAAFK